MEVRADRLAQPSCLAERLAGKRFGGLKCSGTGCDVVSLDNVLIFAA